MFHLRPFWQSDRFPNEEFNPEAFCYFTFDKQTCLITGSFSGTLRFFFPTKSGDSTPFTEISLNAPILQIEYGNFLKPNLNTLAVLFPNRLVLYSIKPAETTIVVNEAQSFALQDSSYNFISCYMEGETKPKQILVQSINGYLTIINNNTTSYKIPRFFLPAPFCYIPILESFIFASSDYSISCYRKNMVLGDHGSGDPISEWTYVFGEQVISIHYWQSKSKFVTASSFEIAVVGERMLAVLNESGHIKSIATHNGNAVASHGYNSVNEKNKKCNDLLISSLDKTVCVYLNFQKVWQLTLDSPAIAINIIDVPPHQGLLSFMGIDGQIVVGYLGTYSSKGLGLPQLPNITEEQLKRHIDKVNAQINNSPKNDLLQLYVNVSRSSPKHVELILQASPDNVLNDVNCYVETPSTIADVPPFNIPQLTHEETAFQIDLEPSDNPPSFQTIKVNATFSTNEKRLLCKHLEFDLPFEFFVKKIDARVKAEHKIILNANNGFASLSELFPNLVLKSPHDLSMILTDGQIISISIDSKNKRYRLESNDYGHLGFGISLMCQALQKAAKGTISSKEKIRLTYLLEVAKEHYNLRSQERDLKKTIHANVGELESIQKALIIRYEAATPEPIDDLNELFAKATEVLKLSTKQLFDLQNRIRKVESQIEAHLFTLLNLLNISYGLDEKTYQMLRSGIPMPVKDCTPGWEECVVVCIPAILKKIASGKAGHSFGSTPEFLSNFDQLTDTFESLVNFFAKRASGK